ncbi:Rgp1-domain-containing protein [Leptodontidium sp. MPI-SDFR-AT-0119]|nr:Rgp1-domain-containing protein [Leptodontidium sp. MPI-SDFR-AT-0119]
MSAPLTNIRVFVQWTQQTVFAGEDIECQITFKNIANTPTPPRTSLHPSSANGSASADRQRKTAVSQIKDNANLAPRSPSSSKGHRTTLSLNVPASAIGPPPASGLFNGSSSRASKDGNSHKRSVSIISIGASEGGGDDFTSHGSFSERPRGGSRGHGRSASLQIVPRRQAINGGPPSAPINQRSATHPSPLNSLFSPKQTNADADRPMRRQPGVTTAPSTPNLPGAPFARRKGSGSLPQTFKFPAISSPSPDGRPNEHFTSPAQQDSSRLLSPRSRDNIPAIPEKLPSMARVLSPASMAGTPRSSGEFYSLSNNSTETLASEYLPQQPGRAPVYGGHARHPSNLTLVNHHRPPETLMMGYAQIHGSFTLDASLISQAPFEEVKRKGAVGGQGGGVIGVENNKRDSGLLRGFGWGNFGESLGGLLGGGELSSIKDMRGIASSRSIPLLSTPQSILFVDLRLAPGESRTYRYTFKLPRGLPPSHRGKAIKICYKLVIGTQRPGGAKEQQVKSVEVPFRILGSVNSHGELLGHDLMSPYIILRDQARVQTVETPETNLESSKELEVKTTRKSTQSTLDDFLTYVDELLTAPRQNSSAGLLSPTELPRSRRQSSLPEPTSATEAIDMAILRSNIATDSRQSANRFEIARSGKRVAVVMLARPAYRLGETISAAIDFSDAEIPCYAIHASLETSEKVDNSISLRSEASILRVTRKIHASHSESTLFARRVIFSPTIPISATPEFITSGVSLDWRVRIEFVTPRLVRDRDAELGYADLLEEVSRDDRGLVLAAAEALECESFEIAVPLRIYGALAMSTERDEGPASGLVV